MAQLAARDRETVERAYDRAQLRLAALTTSNTSRESELRTESIAYLESLTEEIEDLGFLANSTDFDQVELEELLDAAEALDAAEDALVQSDQCTRHELEADLASMLQDILTGRYLHLLNLWWLVERRRYRWLPETVPEEVADDFNVGMFNKCTVALNMVAIRVETVAAEHCLNSDDYSPSRFGAIRLRAGRLSAADATNNFVTVQRLEAAARSAQAEQEPSFGEKIWAIVGWDSPWDFAVDVALGVATGGLSKAVKWGQRVVRLRKGATVAVSQLEKALMIEKRLESLRERAATVQRTGDRLRKANKLASVPGKMLKLLRTLERNEARLRTLERLGLTVTKDYLRSVASSVASKSFVSGSSARGSALGKSAALLSVRKYLDASPLGVEIARARSKVNLPLLMKDGLNLKNVERFHTYFGLLLARELIGRLIYSGVHTSNIAPKALIEQALKDFIDSFMVALEQTLLELRFLSADNAHALVRTVSSSLGKTAAEYGKLFVAGLFR